MDEHIAKLLALLELMEQPGFIPATWPKLEKRFEKGRWVTPMPYPEYGPVIEELRTAVWQGPQLDPYAPLPEDPLELKLSPGQSFPIEYFEAASLNQVRRYLMLCCRGERFSDGHIDSEFRNGKIVAALRRLKVLSSQ